MANVEVQLDVKAEYKQAYAAIQLLGKALDAVQQRAKVALAVSGGAQGGSQGTGGTGEAETQQKAAVEALSAAMKDAAAAAATLAESVAKLTPALEAMGPQAEQVQQVLTLAEHYKQLAAAMGVAADAAAKYNASGAQQGETDARIEKLMKENQALMELVSNIRAEYAEIVKRNAELNRTKTAREESSRSAREELEVTEDLSYQMQLAAMSKRELTAEIARLTKERKEAAKAGDEAKYKELTEELKLARQAMTKLRQEQQLARIAWMQQAQTAQQMGQSVRTLADGFMNFGEAVENGTVNLTGMVSAVTSLSYTIKAGLAPLGWALAAVELLTTAWNMYAKSQKEAAKAEEERQKKTATLITSYHEAAEAVEELARKEADRAKVDALKRAYSELNDELQTRNDLLDSYLRKLSSEALLTAKEDEYEILLKKNEIMRAYWTGSINEEERDTQLDSLNLLKAQMQENRIVGAKQKEFDIKKEKLDIAAEKRYKAGTAKSEVDAEGWKYMFSVEEMQRRVHSLAIYEKNLREAEEAYNEIEKEIKKEQAGKDRASEENAYIYEARIARLTEKLEEAKESQKRWNDSLNELKKSLGVWEPMQIESGQYEARKAAHDTLVTQAQTNLETAIDEYKAAKKAYEDAEEALQNVKDTEAANVYRAEQNITENKKNREAERTFKENKKRAAEAERREKAEAKRKEQEEKARKEREQMQRAVVQEAIAEKASLPRELEGFINGGAYNMLKNGLSQKEAEIYEKAFKVAAKVKNKALFEMLEFLLKQADEDGKTTNQIMAKLKQTRKNTEKLVD